MFHYLRSYVHNHNSSNLQSNYRVRDGDHPVTGQLSSYLPALLGRSQLGKIGSANTKAQHASVEPFPFSTSKIGKMGKRKLPSHRLGSFGDPYRIRTDVNGVRGRCLNHLTNGPFWIRGCGTPSGTRTLDTLIKSQVLYQLS